jgi:polyphosphate kinase 2 (PPK2 family)
MELPWPGGSATVFTRMYYYALWVVSVEQDSDKTQKRKKLINATTLEIYKV